jgi:hypothetical protein
LRPVTASADPPSATGISAQFTQHGDTALLGPFARLGEPNSPPYRRTAEKSVRETLPVVASGGGPVARLDIDAPAVELRVGAGTQAAVAIDDLNLALQKASPTGAPPPAPFLALAATSIKSTALFYGADPHFRIADGSAAFDGLVVSGSLIGHQEIEFSGNAGKNKVLFKKAGVTITLNREVVLGYLELGRFWAIGVTARAVDIVLHNVNLAGQIVSGEIFVATSATD